MTSKYALADKAEYQERQDKVNAIFDKWKDSPYLDDAPLYIDERLAVMLDNQQLMNATLDNHFAEISLELVKQVFKDGIIFDLVSVQPMLKPKDLIYFADFKKKEGEVEMLGEHEVPVIILEKYSTETIAHSRLLRSHYNNRVNVKTLAEEIRNELIREILCDLRNNCGTSWERKTHMSKLDRYEVDSDIHQMCDVIHRKTLRGVANWVVTGPTIAKLLWHEEIEYTQGIKRIILFGGSKHIFVDPLFPEGQVLCGKSEPFINGYIYSPGIPFQPILRDSELPEGQKSCGIMTRYGKKLLNNRFYGLIKYKVD